LGKFFSSPAAMVSSSQVLLSQG